MIRFARQDRDFVCEAEQWLPCAPPDLVRFVGDCRHMNHVLPSFIRFEILGDDPPALAPGVTYDYRLALHGVPFRWRTEITEVDLPHYFEDRQARGPYASFVHEHFYEPADGGTRVRDLIRYRPPGGPLAPLIDRLLVRRDLRRLFEHRHTALAELYETGGDPALLITPRQAVAGAEPA